MIDNNIVICTVIRMDVVTMLLACALIKIWDLKV